MPDTRADRLPSSLGVTESGNPLAWRSPTWIWTFGDRLVLEDGSLVWRMDLPHDGHHVEPEFRLISEFVRLADKSVGDDQILAFARSWGMLGLCPHGLPRTHDKNLIPYSISFGLWVTGDWHCSSGLASPELVTWWRYWAGQARGLVDLIAAVRADEFGKIEDWETLWSPGPWAHGELWDRSRDVIVEIHDDLRARAIAHPGVQREQLAGALETWLRLAGVKLRVNWGSDRATLALGNAALFDTIGLLLLFLAGDLEGFAMCRGCHAPVIPRRRLGTRDRGHWCPACRAERRPGREAKRAYYRRRAADDSFRAGEAERRRKARARQRRA